MARLLLLGLIASLAFVVSHSALATMLGSEMQVESNPASSGKAQIVDNSDSGFTTTGYTADCNRRGGYNGKYCRGKKDDRFIYTFNNDSGRYDIYAYYPEHWLAHTTYFDVNKESITVDQRKNGNQWVKIKTQDLPKNAVITGRTNSYNNGNFDALALVTEGSNAPDGSPPSSIQTPEPAVTAILRKPARNTTAPRDTAAHIVDDAINDAEMIAAIRKSLPAQHATEARFVKIPGSKIDVLVRCDEFDFGQHIGCVKSHNAFVDWTGGAWNWKDWQMAQPAGGGHADYGGNEVYLAEMKITEGGNLAIDWSRPIDPQPLNDTDCGAPVSGPVASHTYATPVFVESRGEYWHHTTGGWPATSSCTSRGQNKLPGQGGWVHDTKQWRKTDSRRFTYGRAVYHRNADKIYLRQQSGGGDVATIDPADGYSVTVRDRSGWFSGAGLFDSAMDQQRNIEYWYHNKTGIAGVHRPLDGPAKSVFQSVDKTIRVPSLSVEHSTGDLIIVGVNGYALHLNAQTGITADISASDKVGLVSPSRTGENIYGKFDMIEKVPCVGIGTADPRHGVYLMVLPASVCSLDSTGLALGSPPVRGPLPESLSEVGSATFMERCSDPAVVFCDPLSTRGPYGKDKKGKLRVLTNPDGSEGIPTQIWWKKWRGIQQWGNNTAEYDPEKDALKLVMTDSRGSSGLFTTNFSKDLQTQFAEGDTFRIEFQVRYNCEYIYVDCDPRSPTFKTDRRPIINGSNQMQGAKIAIVGEGDAKPGESANACVRIQIVPHSGTGHTLEGFHHCGKYLGFDKGTGKSIQGSKQLDSQAGGEFRCLRFPDDATRKFADWGANGTGPNCAHLEADEWMTFAMEVHIGKWQNARSGPPASRVRFFLAGEGEPLREVINLPRHLSGPDSRYWGYGKIWLQVHSTKAKTNTGRPPIVAWYRHLLVSRK